MKPTDKHEAIDSLLSSIAMKDRKSTISRGGCMTCSSEDNGPWAFKDRISITEYRISGMCQVCQDEAFGDSLGVTDKRDIL